MWPQGSRAQDLWLVWAALLPTKGPPPEHRAFLPQLPEADPSPEDPPPGEAAAHARPHGHCPGREGGASQGSCGQKGMCPPTRGERTGWEGGGRGPIAAAPTQYSQANREGPSPAVPTCFSTFPSRPIMLGSSGSSPSAGPLVRSLSVTAGPRPTIWSTLPGRDPAPQCESEWVRQPCGPLLLGQATAP